MHIFDAMLPVPVYINGKLHGVLENDAVDDTILLPDGMTLLHGTTTKATPRT